MQDLFTNTFPLDGKIKLSVAGVSENGRKKWFPLARKSVSTSRNKVIFQIFSLAEKKCPNKRILFQLDTKSVSIRRNGEII